MATLFEEQRTIFYYNWHSSIEDMLKSLLVGFFNGAQCMLSFENYNRSMRVPFIVYADFESFIKPIDTCQPDPSLSYSYTRQKTYS